MNTNVIARHIGIGMLAFCATFVQTSMFATVQFGGAANAQSVHSSDTARANGAYAATSETAGRQV